MPSRWWVRAGLVFGALLLALALLPAQSTPAVKGKKYVLLVGANEYRSNKLSRLKYAENDVEELAALLRKPAAFSGVRVLSGARGKKDSKDAPTAASIRKAVAELLKGKGKHDLVLVALSGHGVLLRVDDPDGKGKPKSFTFFCPADAKFDEVDYRSGQSKTLINVDHLLADLGKCGAGSRLLLVDASRNDPGAAFTPNDFRAPRDVAALFSCSPGQQSFESARLKHSVFYYQVLEGLRGKAKNADGEVTWDDLSLYVRRQVSRQVPKLIGSGAKQTPHLIANIASESPVLVKFGSTTDEVK